jgi:hypothetical protein
MATDIRHMNDWSRIETELFADTSRSRGTLQQAWRWTAPARLWLDLNVIDARTVCRGDIERFLREGPADQGAKKPRPADAGIQLVGQRRQARFAPRSRSADTARARLHKVAARSPLGKAIASVLASAQRGRPRALANVPGHLLALV